MSGKRTLRTVALNLLILCLCLVALFPLFWIFVTSLKGQAEILKYPLEIIPHKMMFLENIQTVLSRAPWGIFYKNTILLTMAVLLVQLALSIPAAFAFACLKFRFKNIIFLLVLTRMMISPESVMLPNYMIILRMNLHDTMTAMALPYLVSAIAIFMFRQAFLQIPTALRDSASIDGCGDFRYLVHIAVPSIRSSILAFSMITVVFQWNAFFWPMLVTEKVSNRTLPVALSYFGLQAESGSEWGLTMTAALIVIAPLLVAFAFFQKQFINSFISSGLK